MKVKELKEALDKMPQDEEVIMYDGPGELYAQQGVCLPMDEHRSDERKGNN